MARSVCIPGALGLRHSCRALAQASGNMSMLDEFERLTASWHAAMEAGDARTANKQHDHIVLLLGKIEQAGQQGYLVENMEALSDAACLFVASRLDKQDPVAFVHTSGSRSRGFRSFPFQRNGF